MLHCKRRRPTPGTSAKSYHRGARGGRVETAKTPVASKAERRCADGGLGQFPDLLEAIAKRGGVRRRVQCNNGPGLVVVKHGARRCGRRRPRRDRWRSAPARPCGGSRWSPEAGAAARCRRGSWRSSSSVSCSAILSRCARPASRKWRSFSIRADVAESALVERVIEDRKRLLRHARSPRRWPPSNRPCP